MQLEGSRRSSLNSAVNDRAVQNPESRRIRLEGIATIVLADRFAETIPSPPEEEEDDPPGYFDILESSGTVSTHTYTIRGGKRGSQNPIHNQKQKETTY